MSIVGAEVRIYKPDQKERGLWAHGHSWLKISSKKGGWKARMRDVQESSSKI